MWPGPAPGRSAPRGARRPPTSRSRLPRRPPCGSACSTRTDVETRHQLTEHTLGVWHGEVPGVQVGQRYGFRADGPWDPRHGRRFNPHKLLLDPYARADHRRADARPGAPRLRRRDADERAARVDSAPSMPRSVVVHDEFDWGDDRPMRRRWRDTVIYELHVKGFTQLHNEIPEHLRGTYAGLGTPTVTDYLNDLGVTAVELLPVHQFFTEPAVAARGHGQLLGLQLDRLLRPARGVQLLGRPRAAGHRVQADGQELPRGRHRGATSTWSTTTRPRARRPGRRTRSAASTTSASTSASGAPGSAYWDVTGCGNTVDSTNQDALRLILDSLRYWVTEMHVDGFRFDLASALARTGHEIDMRCAFLTTIGQDPVLRHVKLIAEPWDASMDGYLVGLVPAAVGGVERHVPRHHARLLALSPAAIRERRVAAVRLLRPVRRRRPLAVRVGELRDRARRLHGARPGLLRPQAQRGQRRAQPRRHRQQPLVEPRRRGRDRRPRDRRAPAAAGRQPDDHAVPVERRAR